MHQNLTLVCDPKHLSELAKQGAAVDAADSDFKPSVSRRARWSLVTLFGMSLGALALGCAAPDTAVDLDDNGDEPGLQDQAIIEGGGCISDDCSFIVYGEGGGYPAPPNQPPAILKVALKTSNGKYLTASAGDIMWATASTVTATETFEVYPNYNYSGLIFRTSAGLYVLAKNGGNDVVYVNSPISNNYSVFSLVNLAGGKTGFKSYYGYDLAAAYGGGGLVITAPNPNPTWRTFTMVDVNSAPLSHPLCSVGTPLNGAMGSCVVKVCLASPQCCTTSWDASCVAAATNVCGLTC